MDQGDIRKGIDALSTDLRSRFAAVEQLSPDQAGAIVRRYTAAFIGNFMTWLSAGAIASRSADARHAMAENLEVEFRDDHQGMLWDFAASVKALPDADDYRAVQEDVQSIRQEVAKLNGVQLNALAAILETTSLSFIPYLEALARKLGDNSANLRYTRVHGEADVLHADQFVNALAVEMHRDYADPGKDFQSMIDLSGKLLKTIFATGPDKVAAVH